MNRDNLFSTILFALNLFTFFIALVVTYHNNAQKPNYKDPMPWIMFIQLTAIILSVVKIKYTQQPGEEGLPLRAPRTGIQ